MAVKSLLKWFVLVLAVWACTPAPRLDDQTIALVGAKRIDFASYKARYADYLDVTYIKDNLRSRRLVLNNMINEKLLYDFDDNSAIYNDHEYQKEQAWATKEMLLGYVKDQEIYAKITATEEELRKAFVRMNEKIAARHLYAPKKEEADRLYEALMHGADFQTLARQTFTDSVLKNNGGYLGYFSWDDMDQAFEEAAYHLKPGEISKPVKTAQGYSIIKVEDRKKVPILTENMYLTKKHDLERLVRISKKRKAEEAFVKSIFDEKALAFNDNNLQVLLQRLRNSFSNKQDETIDLNAPCVQYGDKKYSLGKIEEKLRQIPDFHLKKIRSLKDLRAALKGLIVQEKLLGIAKSKKYARVPVVKKALANAHNNVYLKFKRRAVVQAVQVPDSLLQVFYYKHIDKFQTAPRIRVREILVDNQALALKLKARLLKGASFAELARKYSMRKWSAQNGGDMGWADVQRFGNLKDKLWKAPVNSIVGPLEINRVFGLFEVLQKEKPQPVRFEKIRRKVLETYKSVNNTELMRTYLQALRSRAEIKINNKLLKKFVLN